MKRFLALTLALLIVMTMAACGGSGGKAADPNTLVVWHDKEAAVIEALQAYLDKALPDITVRFEKKTSLTDSLKLVGNDPSSAPDLFVFAHDKIGVFAEIAVAGIEQVHCSAARGVKLGIGFRHDIAHLVSARRVAVEGICEGCWDYYAAACLRIAHIRRHCLRHIRA